VAENSSQHLFDFDAGFVIPAALGCVGYGSNELGDVKHVCSLNSGRLLAPSSAGQVLACQRNSACKHGNGYTIRYF
jgi:hypothetical protein